MNGRLEMDDLGATKITHNALPSANILHRPTACSGTVVDDLESVSYNDVVNVDRRRDVVIAGMCPRRFAETAMLAVPSDLTRSFVPIVLVLLKK